MNIQVLANNLLLENYALTEAASSGKEALAFLDTGYKPDIILLNIIIMQMTGYEVCEKVGEKFTALAVPIVMLTAQN